MANETLAAIARAMQHTREWGRKNVEATISHWSELLYAARADDTEVRRSADEALSVAKEQALRAFESLANGIESVARLARLDGKGDSAASFEVAFGKDRGNTDIYWEVKRQREGQPAFEFYMNGGINWSTSSNTWSVNT